MVKDKPETRLGFKGGCQLSNSIVTAWVYGLSLNTSLLNGARTTPPNCICINDKCATIVVAIEAAPLHVAFFFIPYTPICLCYRSKLGTSIINKCFK